MSVTDAAARIRATAVGAVSSIALYDDPSHSLVQLNPLTKNAGSIGVTWACSCAGVARPSGEGTPVSMANRTQLSGATVVTASRASRSGDGGYRFVSQRVAARSVTGAD